MCEGVEYFDRYQKDTLISFRILPGEISFNKEHELEFPTEDKIELKFKIDENTSETITYYAYNFVACSLVREFSIDDFLASKHFEGINRTPSRKYGKLNFVFMMDSVSIQGINE